MTQKRSFTAPHREALRKGAKMRSDEQRVGNYIRRCNQVLWAQLLREATSDSSPTVSALASWLPSSGSNAQAQPPRAVPQPQGPSRTHLDSQPTRKPPPKMDII